jgi:PilZ domain
MSGEHRREPRYPFVATAEVLDEESGSTIWARLGDLSRSGCLIRMINPLPKGTSISIRVSAGTTVFNARGKVVNAQAGHGVGVEFQEIEPRYLAVLEEWLLEAKDLNTTDRFI